MGLDMNLYKKTYIGNNNKDKKEQIKINIRGVNQDKVIDITEEVAYWRKANAIHKWFVDNIQDGVDDCKEYYVSKEKLKELLKTVNTVLKSIELKAGKKYWFKKGQKDLGKYERSEITMERLRNLHKIKLEKS